MAVPTWSVAEVCEAISLVVGDAFPDELWVRGRIRDMRRTRPGHVYFDLVDLAPDDQASWDTPRLASVAFRGHLRGIEAVLTKVGNLQLEDGIDVRVRGRLEYYPPQGRVQLIVTAIDPRHTLGQLAADRDAVLRALAQADLIDRNGRLPMPLLPLRIGLVTSEGSAAYEDFCHELRVSPYGFTVLLADARVQGADAEATLVAALAALTQHDVDVLCVVRGGGARTDLLAFDSASVARAVATAPVPVLVGIGHEIDRSVVDEVAHTAFKTPTACAAALVTRVAQAVARLDDIAARARGAVSGRLTAAAGRLDARADTLVTLAHRHLRAGGRHLDGTADRLGVLAGRHLRTCELRVDGRAGAVAALAHRRLRGATQHLDARAGAVAALAQRRLRGADEQVHAGTGRLRSYADRPLASAAASLQRAESVVRAVHPDRTLARGFTITRTGDGRLLRRPDVDPGTLLVTQLAAGAVQSTVTDRHEEEP
jgi:exodeoxyribonuclease VII large subunit